MNITEIKAQVKEKQKEIKSCSTNKALKDKFLKEQKSMFHEAAKQILEKHPKVQSFSWTQYTPYFNDGDTCHFSASTDYIKINDEDTDHFTTPTKVTHNGNWNRDTRTYENRVEIPNPKYDPAIDSAEKEITDFLGIFDDDFYESAFGDHVEVIVTRDRIKTEEYEHE